METYSHSKVTTCYCLEFQGIVMSGKDVANKLVGDEVVKSLWQYFSVLTDSMDEKTVCGIFLIEYANLQVF